MVPLIKQLFLSTSHTQISYMRMDFFTTFGGSEGKGTINTLSYEQSANGVWDRHLGFKNQLPEAPFVIMASTKPPAEEQLKRKPPKYYLSIKSLHWRYHFESATKLFQKFHDF